MKTTDIDRGLTLNRTSYYKDSVKYRQLHHRIEYILGKPRVCDNENCDKQYTDGPKQFHWSSVNGKYFGNIDKVDLWDWQRLCARCHKRYDIECRKNPNGNRLPLWTNKFNKILKRLEED